MNFQEWWEDQYENFIATVLEGYFKSQRIFLTELIRRRCEDAWHAGHLACASNHLKEQNKEYLGKNLDNMQ
jgi:hypothetical protein